MGEDDLLPKVLLSLYFIETQGYPVNQKILYQDNMATMRIEVNGDFSSSKKTKHIKSNLFFIKDNIEDEDIDVQYLPTGKMWSGLIKNPKQRATFWLDRIHLQKVPLE